MISKIIKYPVPRIFGTTYTNAENTSSNIHMDKTNNNNAKETGATMAHEVAHVRQNQGQTRLREGNLNEEYAETFEKYGAEGMEFSATTYTNVDINTKKLTLPKTQTQIQNDQETLASNTNDYQVDKNKADNEDGKLEDRTFYTMQDIHRTKDLDSENANDRIKALIETGNSKEKILEEIVKDENLRGMSQEDFDKIYSKQKNSVDRTIELTDNMMLSLEASSLAIGGRETVKNIAESITKKSMGFSVENAVTTSAFDVTTQVITQIYNDKDLQQELMHNPTKAIQKIVNNIDWIQTSISAGIGSTSIKTGENLKNLTNRVQAKKTVQKQLDNTKSSTSQNKLTDRIEKIDGQIIGRTIVLTTPIVTKPMINNDLEEKAKETIKENLLAENIDENN